MLLKPTCRGPWELPKTRTGWNGLGVKSRQTNPSLPMISRMLSSKNPPFCGIPLSRPSGTAASDGCPSDIPGNSSRLCQVLIPKSQAFKAVSSAVAISQWANGANILDPLVSSVLRLFRGHWNLNISAALLRSDGRGGVSKWSKYPIILQITTTVALTNTTTSKKQLPKWMLFICTPLQQFLGARWITGSPHQASRRPTDSVGPWATGIVPTTTNEAENIPTKCSTIYSWKILSRNLNS